MVEKLRLSDLKAARSAHLLPFPVITKGQCHSGDSELPAVRGNGSGRAGGMSDCVLGVCEVQCSRGHGEVRKDRGYGAHEWAARRPGEDSGIVATEGSGRASWH